MNLPFLNIVKNNKKIIENFSFLTLFQLFALLSPMITYPYLIKVIGLDLYGSVVFAQTIITYFSLIVNFGFGISGPRDVANLKGDKTLLSEYVSSVFILKMALWLISFLLFIVLISFFDYFENFFLLYFYSFFITVGDVIFPIWFFQGIEKMKYITYINIIVKMIFILCIFLLVKEKEDYLFIPIVNAVGALVSGIISLYILIKKEKVSFTKVNFDYIKQSFKESFALFISSISTNIYLSLNKLIVGSLLSMKEVGIYDLAEKVVSLIKTPVIMLSQALFPKIAREKSLKFINKFLMITLIGVLFIYIGLVVFSDYIVNFFIHTSNRTAVDIIRIYGISMFFLTINMFLGGLRLIPFGFNKHYMYAMSANGIFYIFLISLFYLLDFISLYTITLIYVMAEAFCSFYLLFINKKLKLI